MVFVSLSFSEETTFFLFLFINEFSQIQDLILPQTNLVLLLLTDAAVAEQSRLGLV